ncbi:Hypothetical predicted protein [Paramuricea clavata]|uniref:Uncharacterized protein n=1 Tax=Paramuricea clavata TaxID=317549 RepID=A0A6S7IXS4_PARCT|nr:Hypothetical predicted protein [Paramuricea clavata]
MYALRPEKEVVSIYNDDFTTPPSRPPYFIEVYRCVKVELGGCFNGPNAYPVPKKVEEIEILVPDITNKVRDPSSKKNFYKYVVYNHTACTCGRLEYRTRKLYKTITNNEVSEAYFNIGYSKNPVNLLRVCDVCNNPQPRYQLAITQWHIYVIPPHKYLGYQLCLPGCIVIKNSSSKVKIWLMSDKVKLVTLTNDISCKAYDGPFSSVQYGASNFSLARVKRDPFSRSKK